MLANPKVGTRVCLHYHESIRSICPHGQTGTVVIVSKGKPRNHGIKLDSGPTVVVPCGNLVKADGDGW